MLTICSGKISGNADADSLTVSEVFKPLASTLLNIKIINLLHKSIDSVIIKFHCWGKQYVKLMIKQPVFQSSV